MSRPNKIISILIVSTFLLNILTPDVSACWWKSQMGGHGSPTTNGQPGEGGNNTGKPNQTTAGDPVYVHNGDFMYTFQDLFIPSRGIPIEIKHSFKSKSNYNNRVGQGWDMNYNQRIVALANGDVQYFDGSNMRLQFGYIDGTNYSSPPNSYDKLTFDRHHGTWTLTKKGGVKYYFTVMGSRSYLSKIEDRNNNTITFTYCTGGVLPIYYAPRYPRTGTAHCILFSLDWQLVKITDTIGRDIDLAYDEDGKLKTITDFAGRTISYTYDTNGDLKTITKPPTPEYPDGTTTTFTYTSDHRLVSIIDPKGQTYITNHYNGQGMVDAQEYGGNTTYFNYVQSNKTEVTDAKNFKTAYTFNDKGNVTRKEVFTTGLRLNEPTSFVTNYEYNNHMELTKITYPKGNFVEYIYDAQGRGNLLQIKRVASPVSNEPDIVTTYTYETRFDFVKTKRDPKGNITTYYYDYEEGTLGDLNGDGVTNADKGNLVKISYPQVDSRTPEIKFTYNSYGQLETATGPAGHITKYEYYPETGYLKKITRGFGTADQSETVFTYDSVGNIKTVTDPRLNTTTFSYNSQNQITQTISPGPFNYITNYYYDANGNLKEVSKETRDSANPWQTTTYTYDTLDRLKTMTDDLDHTTTYYYDANGNRERVEDAESKSTVYEYDERNLLLRIMDVNSNITEYNYDENGNLKEIVDAKQNITGYSYDGFDRAKTTTFPDLTQESYDYDANSNLTSKTTRKSEAITYAYDELNRLKQKSTPEGTITYAYDTASRLETVTDPRGTTIYGYDALNRVKSITYPDSKSLSYDYDSAGNRTKLTYPDSSFITYEYDELNRLKEIKDSSGDPIASYTYDPLSRRKTIQYANNTEIAYDYDAANRLNKLENRQTGQPNSFSRYDYTYDNVGNRKTMKVNDADTSTYTYDNIYQLTNVTAPSQDKTYDYDKLGNRKFTIDSGLTTIYTSDNMNQYTSVSAITYSYDDNGNLTSDGTNTYAYDRENRLISAISPQHSAISYTYDPYGRRISNAVDGAITNYVYDGDSIIAEYDASGNIQAKYIYGPRIDEPICMMNSSGGFNLRYYHFDGLGSVTGITDPSGSIIEQYEYDAYGSTTIKDPSGSTIIASLVGNRFMFTGRELDPETSLYYYRARYYSPQIGRFLQTDSVGYRTGLNLYTYCSNNPLNYVDPLGLEKTGGEGEKPWWQKLEEGYYYGTGFGEEAAEWYAQQYVETGNPLWVVPGLFASLWTPETWMSTLDTLLLAAQANQILKATYWQYYPADNPAYDTRYMVRGTKPPYQTGEEAVKALNLPQPRNPGTAVRRVDVKPWEPVRGPRPVGGGTGKEYYRGWRWPKR
ncbi:MAG: DUF6531 domain-containing protein [Candidatus Omnitrophica bacterium]|nr:DUF6531 domain-containing protein [Candidatus Omnitrophota bacterium]